MNHASTLLERTSLANGFLLRIQLADSPLSCQPGQYYLLNCGASGTLTLRRPLFPSHIAPSTLTFWGYPLHDNGLAWLLTQPDGAPIDLLGPLGKGFTVHMQQQRLLLVAEGPSIAPVLSLIQPHLERGGSVGLLLEAATADDLLPPSVLPPAVEYYTATADGSAGQPGDLSELWRSMLPWADLVCAAGSWPFLQRLKRIIGEVRFSSGSGFCQALAPVPLPCGIGACLACLVNTGRGWHRACQRGPIFDLAELAP